MTTATEIDLRREYTEEERDAMFIAYAEACGRGDREVADRILEEYPINHRWAKIILEVMGKDYLLENFNITHATKILGEGWMDGK